MNLNNIKSKVFHILAMYDYTRNCDKKLYVRYLKEFHKGSVKHSGKHDADYLTVDALFEVPVASVERARRLIQASGQYLPTDPAVRKARHLMEITYKEFAKEGQMEMTAP